MAFRTNPSGCFRILAVAALGGLVASCATKPVRYQGLASSTQLRATGGTIDKRVAFSTALDAAALKAYGTVLLEPVRIYRGSDHQFGTLSENDKTTLARHADAKFRMEMQGRHLLSVVPGPTTLRMTVTITGADTSVPVLSTVTKVTPVGLALSGLRLATDREGSFSGSVIYAVELADSVTGTLVYAYVTRQYPNALNVPATVLPLDAAKAGIDRGASVTASSLNALMRRNPAR